MSLLEHANQDFLIDFVCDLVRIPSVLGNEREMAEFTSRRMRELGFDHVEIDEAGNAIGTIQGGSDGPTLIFDAHMDTVDVHPRESWSRDPFGGDRASDRIYGRGSSDMKGALGAMVYAAACADRSKIAGRIVVSASVGEELIEGAALRVVMDKHRPDFVVIGESSDLNLVRAGRGRAEVVIDTVGRPAHASSPQSGIHAVHKMIRVIEQIEALEMPEDSFVGPGVMCLTDMISVPYPAHSVVPSGCRATYERRLVPGESREGLISEMKRACERAGVPDTRVELARTNYETYTGLHWEEPKWYPPWILAEDHQLVQRALEGLGKAGLMPRTSSYQFCTNATYSAGVRHVPTIGFGPSRESLAHIVDESLEIDQLLNACRGYASISNALLAPV